MRALRIHHEKRVKEKVKTYFLYYKTPDPLDQDRICGIVAHSKARCSCWMCGNPRKFFGDRTRQELVHLVELKEGIDEV